MNDDKTETPYIVKAFKPFELLQEEYQDREQAHSRFWQLRSDPAYDAVYVFKNGNLLLVHSWNYDDRCEECESYSSLRDSYGYVMRDIPKRFQTYVKDSDHYRPITWRDPSGIDGYVFHVNGESETLVNVARKMDVLTANEMCYLLNHLQDITYITTAITQALEAGDTIFAKAISSDLTQYILSLDSYLENPQERPA